MSQTSKPWQIGYVRWGANGMESSIQNVPGDTSDAWVRVYMVDRTQYPPSQYVYRYERREDEQAGVAVYEIVDGPIPLDYREQRRQAYPDIGDQLDAIWKGGAELDAMRAAVMAVKEQIPKPTPEE